jgi:hypothetical protein
VWTPIARPHPLPGNTKLTPISTRDNSTNMDSIHAAVEDLETRDDGDDISYQKIADKHNVERSTLTRRARGQNQPRKEAAIARRLLSPQQADEVVDYIESLTAQCLPPTRAMIRNFASTIAKTQVSKKWVDRFVSQNQDRLTSRWTDAIDQVRHQANSGHRYKAFFEELYSQIEKNKIQARHSYNMDEKGFLLRKIRKLKRIFSQAL